MMFLIRRVKEDVEAERDARLKYCADVNRKLDVIVKAVGALSAVMHKSSN
jgi:hypothetical protein